MKLRNQMLSAASKQFSGCPKRSPKSAIALSLRVRRVDSPTGWKSCAGWFAKYEWRYADRKQRSNTARNGSEISRSRAGFCLITNKAWTISFWFVQDVFDRRHAPAERGKTLRGNDHDARASPDEFGCIGSAGAIVARLIRSDPCNAQWKGGAAGGFKASYCVLPRSKIKGRHTAGPSIARPRCFPHCHQVPVPQAPPPPPQRQFAPTRKVVTDVSALKVQPLKQGRV